LLYVLIHLTYEFPVMSLYSLLIDLHELFRVLTVQ
jgi:hypothetical protein